MKKTILIWVLISLCAFVAGGLTYSEDSGVTTGGGAMSRSEAEIRSTNRVLWESRATLLRAFIVSAMNDSTGADEAKDKLIKNAGDLGASIQPYYGYWARSMLTGLLKKDVRLTGDVIDAAKSGNEASLDWAKKKWYLNAYAVATFFYIARNQTKSDLKDMFYKHLDLTWGEIEAILKKDKAKDLEYYEKDKAHMLMVSDVLVDGLIKQFPNKFKE